MITDGTSLLGADDKAGVVEIMEAVKYLIEPRNQAWSNPYRIHARRRNWTRSS